MAGGLELPSKFVVRENERAHQKETVVNAAGDGPSKRRNVFLAWHKVSTSKIYFNEILVEPGDEDRARV